MTKVPLIAVLWVVGLSAEGVLAKETAGGPLAQSQTRDFGQSQWTSKPTRHEDTEYVYDLAFPQAGYAAIFGEAVSGAGNLPSYLSTNVHIVDSDEILTVREGG